MEPGRLDVLAAEVRERAPGTALDRVAAATAVGAELADTGDQLVGYFVAEARRDGCSWTDIGQRMGVSKQAARQRFVPQPAGQAAQPASGSPSGQAASGRSAVAVPRRRRRSRSKTATCSFCGKARSADLRLVAGPWVYICAECIGVANQILAE